MDASKNRGDSDREDGEVVLVDESCGPICIVPSDSSSDEEDEDSDDSSDMEDPAPIMVLNPASVKRATMNAAMPTVSIQKSAAIPKSTEASDAMQVPLGGEPDRVPIPIELLVPTSHPIQVTPAPNLDAIPSVKDVVHIVNDTAMDTNVIVAKQGTAKNSLGLLASYGSDDTDDSDNDVIAIAASPAAAVPKEVALKELEQLISEGNYRIVSDSSDDSDAAADNSSDSEVEVVTKQPKESIKARGEMGIDDLPPIEDLKITVAEEECVELGKIFSIVEQLVLVDSLPGTVPLDLDTVLFLDKGKRPLGQVFDVLGNISTPLYCVRFNSNQEILDKQFTVGTTVYVAPRTEHTTFIILGNLMKQKGCDASWEHDVETPSKCMEFSDDEEERSARRVRRGKQSAGGSGAASEAGDDENKRSRHTDDGGNSNSSSINTGHVLPNYQSHNGNQRRGRGRGRGDFRRGGGGGGRGGNMQYQQYPNNQNGNHQQAGNFDRSRMYPNENYSWHTNLQYGGSNHQQLPMYQQQQVQGTSHMSYRVGYPTVPPPPHPPPHPPHTPQSYSHNTYPMPPYYNQPHYPPQPPT